MTAIINHWKDGEFEETVSAALISCYESKIKKVKGELAATKIDNESLRLARARGLYIPSPSRIILDPLAGVFDIVNDAVPEFGCLAMRKDEKDEKEGCFKGYIHILSFAKKNELPKSFHRRGAGRLYQIDGIVPSNDFVFGVKDYFTISKEGIIKACAMFCDSHIHNSPFGEKRKIISEETQNPARLKQIEANASIAMQNIADKRFCWSITAKESIAKATVGCMMEEVKSLLYARSLPMTETGRKRPILHLVESHNRRMRNGTDIDVTSFLRGQQTVEIGGTIFSVNPPKSIMPTLSKNSQNFAETSI